MKIAVDTHTHTYASGHAYSTLIENARAANERGIALFCTTDHASEMPGAPHHWFFANQKILPRFLEGVGIVRGVEANIMNQQGDVDTPEMVDQRLDWMIGSLHEPVVRAGSQEQQTEMLMNVIKQGRVDALGHLGNPNYDFDFAAVVECAVQYNVAIELNNSSLQGHSRVGSKPRCYEIAKIAQQKGAFITTGSDAHFCSYIGGFDEVLALINEVNIPAEKIITHSPRQFLDFLQLRGRTPIDEFELHFE
ncbi:phosphatase [Vibrio palustris]|uniref:Putative phosphatase YcdX n=1 Tax=Vibrio palustris TaxID=1918946 RepID=A0A1R4B5A3_9VIBR|nr:phosphatase [Vibrio palustris]SJL84108.1 putative phosphatase YcdX [Vibrio palustris]